MHITPVTEASPEQRQHLANLARSKLPPHSCTCSDDPYWEPDDPCYCKPPDPFVDWDRCDCFWAHDEPPANVIYTLFDRCEYLAIRVFHHDSPALLSRLLLHLLDHACYPDPTLSALVNLPPWPSSTPEVVRVGTLCPL
ncbi:g461 [Coccomyxa elongata]